MKNSTNNSERDFTPKYYQVKRKILEKINKGELKPGMQIPSETQLMNEYNISRITARQSIQELVKEGIVLTIQGKGSFVSDKIVKPESMTSQIGKSFLPDLNKRVVFIMTYIINEFYAPILQGVLDVLQPKGYALEVYNSEENYPKEKKLLAKCLQERVRGLLFVPSFSDKKYNHLFQMKKRNIPVVLIDRKINNSSFDFVAADNFRTAKDAVSYLIKQGHRRIVFLGIGVKKTISPIVEKYEGYKSALLKSKIKPAPELVILEDQTGYSSGHEAAESIMKNYLKKKIKFTAVFTINDGEAIGVYRALKSKGIRVPEDISIMGSDDSYISEQFELPLTSMRLDKYNLGYTAGKLLLKRMEETTNISDSYEKILLKTKLIIRKSVRNIK